MAHPVLCPYCRKQFDRDTHPYVLYGKRRYAHADCALREAAKNPQNPVPEVIDPTDIVFCYYCNKKMSRKDKDCILIYEGTYAHKECQRLEEERPHTDKEQLELYIQKKLNLDYIPPSVKKQINSFMLDYNLNYSQILKIMIYGIDISKKMTFDKTHQNLALIPYLYQPTYNYYYSLWLAEQANAGKVIRKPIVEEVKIVSPKRESLVKKHFSFLLEDEIDDL